MTRRPCVGIHPLVSQPFPEPSEAARFLQRRPRLSAREPPRASVDAGRGSWEGPAFRRAAPLLCWTIAEGCEDEVDVKKTLLKLALAAAGVAVSERVPHWVSSHEWNSDYLAVKRAKLGHQT